jgi:hypothetical protein
MRLASGAVFSGILQSAKSGKLKGEETNALVLGNNRLPISGYQIPRLSVYLLAIAGLLVVAIAMYVTSHKMAEASSKRLVRANQLVFTDLTLRHRTMARPIDSQAR